MGATAVRSFSRGPIRFAASGVRSAVLRAVWSSGIGTRRAVETAFAVLQLGFVGANPEELIRMTSGFGCPAPHGRSERLRSFMNSTLSSRLACMPDRLSGQALGVYRSPAQGP